MDYSTVKLPTIQVHNTLIWIVQNREYLLPKYRSKLVKHCLFLSCVKVYIFPCKETNKYKHTETLMLNEYSIRIKMSTKVIPNVQQSLFGQKILILSTIMFLCV